jgi:hypothetical protein
MKQNISMLLEVLPMDIIIQWPVLSVVLMVNAL